MAKVAGEESRFFEVFFKVWFERWPETPTNDSDLVEDLMEIVKKVRSNILTVAVCQCQWPFQHTTFLIECY
jgi:hypothetical protein